MNQEAADDSREYSCPTGSGGRSTGGSTGVTRLGAISGRRGGTVGRPGTGSIAGRSAAAGGAAGRPPGGARVAAAVQLRRGASRLARDRRRRSAGWPTTWRRSCCTLDYVRGRDASAITTMQTYDTLASLGEAVEGGDATRSFMARAHLGNYALWLSGLFPDHIEQRHWRRGGPDMEYFEAMGSRGFRLAADHRLANEHGLAPLSRWSPNGSRDCDGRSTGSATVCSSPRAFSGTAHAPGAR